MTDTQKRPRGRPRPEATVKRDERILAYLDKNGPQTRNALAEKLRLSKTITYLALDRLRHKGQVRICAHQGGPGVLWSSDMEGSCP